MNSDVLVPAAKLALAGAIVGTFVYWRGGSAAMSLVVGASPLLLVWWEFWIAARMRELKLPPEVRAAFEMMRGDQRMCRGLYEPLGLRLLGAPSRYELLRYSKPSAVMPGRWLIPIVRADGNRLVCIECDSSRLEHGAIAVVEHALLRKGFRLIHVCESLEAFLEGVRD